MALDPEMEEVLREFGVETRENLESFEAALLEAEKDPSAAPLLAQLFRSIHSIKGSCGFLGFAKLEALTHAGETLLARLREGALTLDAVRASALLQMVDHVRTLLADIETLGHEGELELSDTVALLQRLTEADGAGATASSVDGADAGSGEDAGADSLEATPPVDAARALLSAATGDTDVVRAGPGQSGKIRVDLSLLDKLMNLVGELVLARNQLVQLSSAQLSGSNAPVQRLNQVTTELQETVMKTRMQPIGATWSRLPRVVRDLAQLSGKRVRLWLEGRETELDKSIVEALQDPLTHLVRNAIDHGIERPEERLARGKPADGTLRLRAFHEGGMVNLEISDDGAGIDVAKVRRKVVEQRLMPADAVSRLSDPEALALIFLPGFSTAEKVTTLSGRGVGMDVVRTNVENIGGTVDVHSRPGLGTTLKIKIPLTLAIVPALIVTSAGARYAIPQASVLEVVRIEEGDRNRAVEHVQGAPVFRLRGKLLPLAFLREELGEPVAPPEDALTLVVLQAGERTFGLVVDGIRDTEEIVVKPLWKKLKALSCFAGATVMGDGTVALILDAIGIGQRVGVVSEARARQLSQREQELPLEPAAREELVLLCRNGAEGRLAIPLSAVARLEELQRSRIERVAGGEAAQYRGEILPLIPAGRVLHERRLRPRGDGPAQPLAETVQVVVFQRDDRRIGLMVDGILDVVGVKLALERHATRPGVLGTMVVQEKITEFLDVDRLMALQPLAPCAGPQQEGGRA